MSEHTNYMRISKKHKSQKGTSFYFFAINILVDDCLPLRPYFSHTHLRISRGAYYNALEHFTDT